MKLQAAKAQDKAARQARKTEVAWRAEQYSPAKLKATEAKEATEAQEDAKLAASEAEAEAIANATQEVNPQAATREEQAASADRRKA